eukprot:6600830-Pyramimonas_sp.AAC.1
MALGGPQRWLKMTSKMAQDSPKWVNMVPKMLQEDPRLLQEDSEWPRSLPIPRRPPRGPNPSNTCENQ